MTCHHCGHHNPPENRFCGMCGHMLLPGAKQPERVPQPAPPQQTEVPRQSEAADAPLTGPSFLGLSSEPTAPAPEPSGYSYLFQDEPEPSHKGLYVFLLLLVIGGGIAYARWQPIRQYVVNNVVPRIRQQVGIAPPPPPQAPPPAPAGDQATISVASNQAEEKPAEAAPAPQPSAPEPQKPIAETDNGQSADVNKADVKSENKGASSAKSKTGLGKSKSTAPDVEADAIEEEAPASTPAARRSRPQPLAGEALVNTGEKYLYGRGVRKNCTQAVSYFRAAAEQQNPRALSRLGTMYAIGECVPMDRAVAYSWFGRALAVDRGNRALERNMSMLWREMSPEERQRAGGR